MTNPAPSHHLTIGHTFRIFIVFVIAFFLSFSTRAQLIQGDYNNSIVYSDHFTETPSSSCYDFEIYLFSSALYDVTGMNLYLIIDSIQGESDSLQIANYSSQIKLFPGDSIFLSLKNHIYFYLYSTSTIFYSIKRIGVPMVAGEMYSCELSKSVGVFADGCGNTMFSYYSGFQECTVQEGSYNITNDFCDNSTELNPGLNWVNNINATGNNDLNLSCFNDIETNTEESGVWYSFTTPYYPIKINLRTSSSQCDTIELVGTQMALFTSCDSTPIACSSPGDSLFAKLEFDCGVLEPNTTYYVLVDGWEGEQGICRFFYNVYEICEIPGCTDPLSCNYNSSAIIDDGTCLYGDECNPELILTVDTIDCHNYSFSSYYEGMWSPYEPTPPYSFWIVNGVYYDTMFSPFGMFYLNDLDEGTYTICSFVYYMQNDSMSTMLEACFDLYVPEFCADTCAISITPLISDCGAEFTLNNLIPDSTNGFVWNFDNGIIQEGGSTAATTYSEIGDYDVCVDINAFGCADTTLCTSIIIESCIIDSTIYGCMDPLANNYNPVATVDDSSCVYINECTFSITAITDSLNPNALVIIPDFDYADVEEILWDFGDGSTSSELYPTHAYAGSGPYELCCTVTFSDNGNLCTSSFCLDLYDPNPGGGFYFSLGNSSTTDIEDHINDNSFKIWPNPVKDNLSWKIDGINTGTIRVEIYSTSGKLVETVNFTDSQEGTLSLSNLESGFYQISIFGDFGVRRAKVIVLR